MSEGASPICRGQNLTMETVLTFMHAMPKDPMPKSEFNLYAEMRMKGWTQTHSQIARQMALYYEDAGMCYPRFTSLISTREVDEYVRNWATRYFIPNPYTPSLKGQKTTNIYAFLKKSILEGKTNFNEICNSMFPGISLNNLDKVRVYLVNFTDILVDGNEMTLNTSVVLDSDVDVYPDITDLSPKEYFDYFGCRFDTDSIEDQFEFYLRNCVSSLRGEDNNFNYGESTITSCLSYMNPRVMFEYNIDKWSKIESLYKITDANEVKNIFDALIEDEEFNVLNKKKGQWATKTLTHYICFLRAREYYSKIKNATSTQYKTENKEDSKEILEYPLQQIFYGAPGTGKSHGIKDQESKFDEVFRTTFHPDTDYSTFVGAYKPIVESVDVKVVPVVLTGSGTNFEQNSGTYKEKKITYKFVKQSFLKAYIAAWKGLKSDKKVLLDIEEINRGNCAQIFGDIFQLLDRDVEGPMVGYSTYPIEADEDIANLLNEEFKNSDIDLAYIKDGSKLLLPPNLYIWATMNTSDQSLFPIDSAFKRRWEWKYVPINYSNTGWSILLGDKEYSWVSFQEKINDKIKDATDGSEDKQMGDFFVNVNHKRGIIDSDLLLNKIVFYLWNDVCKEGEGDIFKLKNGDKTEDISFSQFFKEDSILKLQQWMDYLEVDLYSDPNNNVSVQNQENIESANDEIN